MAQDVQASGKLGAEHVQDKKLNGGSLWLLKIKKNLQWCCGVVKKL